jgi:glycosyltransferase involved in cell wall biosynthesis
MLHLPEYARFLRRARPDWVLSTGNNMNWVTAAGLKLSGLTTTRLVMKTTNPIVRPRDKLLARTIRRAGYRRAFRAADAVLTLSDAETRQLQAMFPREASRFRTVINPYVTPDMLRERPFERSEAERLVLAVGRLQPQKRMSLLIRAIAHVTTPGSRLVILGEGVERPRLEALVRDLGLSDRVELPGFDPDVGTWFARADLFVLPSVYEGLPAVVLEAMAANCPVVSTDCFPAARELVAGAEGCALIERPDPVLLARLIDERFAEPRPTSLRALAETYSIENAQRSHVEAVASLIARHAA